MSVTILANTIPWRSARTRETIEAAVIEGLKNRAETKEYRVRILEDDSTLKITVEIECSKGRWSRSFVGEQTRPDFISRAVECAE
jgi:hypothetical protein